MLVIGPRSLSCAVLFEVSLLFSFGHLSLAWLLFSWISISSVSTSASS